MLVFFYGRHFTLLAGVFAYENLRRNYTEKNWDKLKIINQLYQIDAIHYVEEIR